MAKMNFLNQDPRFPTDAERNEEFPRNIYLKRNIDYVTKLPQKKRAPGAHLQSAYPGVIDLYASIQNAISEGWLSLGDAALDLSSPLEYEDDFSDEFTDNDLVSKLYVDTAISEIDLSGSGIYSGSGNIHPTAYAQLAADTTFSLGRLTSSGAFSYSAGNKESGIQFNTSTGSMVLGTSDASGTGSINVILMGGGTPLGYLYQTPTIQGLLNFNGGVALGYGEVSNANQTQINLTGTQISFSGYNASTAFSYVMPRVTPASDGSTYFLGWTNGTPAFTTISGTDQYIKISDNDTTAKYASSLPDSTSPLKFVVLNDGGNEKLYLREALVGGPVDRVVSIEQPTNGVFTSGTGVIKKFVLAVEVGSGFGSGIVMVDTSDNSGTLNDIKLDADDLPVYINFKGSVTDPTTNQVFPIGDTATTSVQCRVDVFGTEVTLTVYNGRPNTIRANLIIEYLTTA